jgi:glutathione S-transferase
MLTVHKLGPAFGLPDASPFVVKLETWLRMAGIPYRTERGDTRKGPTRKIPYATDGDRVIGDTNLIIQYLKEKHGDRLQDSRFTPAERALGQAMKSMFEADLYFVIVYLRWSGDEDYETYKRAFLDIFASTSFPKFAISSGVALIRRKALGQLEAQGTGRHAREEVYAMGRTLVESASDLLGDKPYFLGNAPSTIDATAYGMLSGIVFAPFDSPVKDCALERANLVDFCERMRERYWAG